LHVGPGKPEANVHAAIAWISSGSREGLNLPGSHPSEAS